MQEPETIDVDLEAPIREEDLPKNFDVKGTFRELMELANNELESIPEDVVGIRRYTLEDDLALDFGKRSAELVLFGLNRSAFDIAISQLADSTEFANKTAFKEYHDEHRRSISAGGHGNRPFDEVIRDDLASVSVSYSSDSNEDSAFDWRFESPNDEYAPFNIQTSDVDRTHFSWEDFRSKFWSASGAGSSFPARPASRYRDGEDWKQFIAMMEEERETERNEIDGPRSAVLRGVKDFIRTSQACPTIKAMKFTNGVAMDANPLEDEEEPSEVCVLRTVVKNLCDAEEITPTEFYQEVSARGLISPNMHNKATESVVENGETVTYWALDYQKLREEEGGELLPEEWGEGMESEEEREERRKEELKADTDEEIDLNNESDLTDDAVAGTEEKPEELEQDEESERTPKSRGKFSVGDSLNGGDGGGEEDEGDGGEEGE